MEKRRKQMRYILSILLPLLLVTGVLFADIYSEEPIADTWVWGGSGPWGGHPALRTNIFPVNDQAIVVRFDLSSIPTGSMINSAVLNIYNYDGTIPTTLECDIYRVTEDWIEATLVDTIAHDTTTSYDHVIMNGFDWYEFDIAILVQDWIDGTYDNFGVVFYGTVGGGTPQYFRSKEAGSNHPYLEVDYSSAGALENTTFGAIKALFAL
jgi:hypothetical protein